MNHRWIRRTDGADTIIVVFGGWGLGWAPFAHLQGPQDILFVEDYRDLELGLPDLSGYGQRWLLAYSLGVASFAHWAETAAGAHFDRAIAACGSLSPVDRRLGIPPKVFQATQEGLTQDSFQSFLALCHGAPQNRMTIDVTARQDELSAIAARGSAVSDAFDLALVATQDRIWPAANLNRAWEERRVAIRHVEAPHVAFGSWQSWQDLFGDAP